MRVAHALPDHEHSPVLLPAQQESREVGMAHMKRPEQRRLTRVEQLTESRGVGRELPAVRLAPRHAKPEHQEFLKRKKMPEDRAPRRHPPGQRHQVRPANACPLLRHGEDRNPRAQLAQRAENEFGEHRVAAAEELIAPAGPGIAWRDGFHVQSRVSCRPGATMRFSVWRARRDAKKSTSGNSPGGSASPLAGSARTGRARPPDPP